MRERPLASVLPRLSQFRAPFLRAGEGHGAWRLLVVRSQVQRKCLMEQ
jgi:hypothetical protein